MGSRALPWHARGCQRHHAASLACRLLRPPLQLQLEKLTAAFQCVTEDLRRQFMVDGEPLLHENSIGSSPVLSSSFRRQIGFSAPERPPPAFSPGTESTHGVVQALRRACAGCHWSLACYLCATCISASHPPGSAAYLPCGLKMLCRHADRIM